MNTYTHTFAANDSMSLVVRNLHIPYLFHYILILSAYLNEPFSRHGTVLPVQPADGDLITCFTVEHTCHYLCESETLQLINHIINKSTLKDNHIH